MSTLYPYLIATGAILSLMTVWVVVQFAWRRVFPHSVGDEDVLAIRPGCHECALDTECHGQPSDAAHELETGACRTASGSARKDG